MKTIEQERESGPTESTVNRRSFIRGAGFTGLGLAGATLIGSNFGSREQRVEAAGVSDEAILNFALNLEYLEAEYDSMATYGATLVQRGILSKSDETGPTTGGKMVKFGNLAYLATAIRNDETHHVLLLRSILGSAAAKKPAINLDAKGYGFSDVNSYLKLRTQFEHVGTSAYLGAAPLISNNKYLATAGAILATEGQHLGTLNIYCVMKGVTVPAVDSRDVPPKSTMPFTVDKNGLSISRTTSEVLDIVYAGGKCSGGFYPDGMNGEIVCRS
jgi:hypothetical protein